MTAHAANCRRVFKQYDPKCSRCLELIHGAIARPGWGPSRREREAKLIDEIRAHDCERSGCGTICTAFEY